MFNRPDFVPIKCPGCVVCKGKPRPTFKRPQCTQRNLVYNIVCNTCLEAGINNDYDGESKRPIKRRLKEHSTKPPKTSQASRNVRKDNDIGFEPSAVATHCMTEHAGKFDLSVGFVGRGKSHAHRKCMEATHCRLDGPTLNRRLEGGGTIHL